ncbi:MAG: MFS transporter [Kiritimatiellae bacterium]|nr:MFS transporter [Kiritimatiellia bacterium]
MRPFKNPSTRLVALCSAAYFTSYLTRKTYEASILSICDDTGLARTAAGLAGTAAVALYGSGQFVTGWLADRIDPRKIVLSALLLTAACNAATPFAAAAGVGALIAVQAVNGFAQAMFWPPLVKILASRLSSERYRGGVFAVNVAANVAIITVFALVAGCVRFYGWRLSFGAVAASALAMAAVWWRCFGKNGTGHLDSNAETQRRGDTQGPGLGNTDNLCASALLRGSAIKSQRSGNDTVSAFVLVPVALAIVCLGALRDGIEAWAPTILSDLYGLETSKAVFSVALLPVFAVASMVAARALRRRLGGEVRAALALFAVGLACVLTLRILHGASLAAGLPLLALLSAAMHGANLLLVCELPGRFAATGHVGTVSGALNACVYAGAAISIYGFAALREHFSSWLPVFGLWAALLTLALALCLVALHRRNSEHVA